MARKSTHGLKFTWITDDAGKRHRVPVGDDYSVYKKRPGVTYPFTLQKAEEICDLYMQGKSMRQIGEKLDLPESVLWRWVYSRPDLKKRLMDIRELRGFYFEEKTVSTAEDTKGESTEEVASQRLKVDTYKWAAEVNNRAVFGKQTKISGDPGAPVVMLVTGVPEPEEKPIEIDAQGLIVEAKSE